MARAAKTRGLARRLMVSGAALVTVGGFVAVAVPAAANAASAEPFTCVFKNGTTSNLATGGNGVHPTGGTIFTKPSNTTCADLNVTSVSATDHYEGWLENSSTGKWAPCSKGFVLINKGSGQDVVLCSGVKATTQMAVVQESNTQRSITVEI
jgi:hypothetical protein